MKNFNPNIPPPNGYVFVDIDGTKIRGTGWKSLERNVVVYRRQTGGKLINVMEEIVEQVCAAVPSFCKEPSPPRGQPGKPKKDLRHVLINYLSQIARASQNRTLSRPVRRESDVRVKTCSGCPFRKNADIGCQSCQSSMAALRKVALGGGQSIASGLGTCDILDNDLPVAVHVNEQGVRDERLPAHCWRKLK